MIVMVMIMTVMMMMYDDDDGGDDDDDDDADGFWEMMTPRKDIIHTHCEIAGYTMTSERSIAHSNIKLPAVADAC